VTRAVRREVAARDGLHCAFIGTNGERCPSQDRLEFDHQTPRALGGTGDAANVRLLCRAHNMYAAEETFGRDRIADRINFRQRKCGTGVETKDRSVPPSERWASEAPKRNAPSPASTRRAGKNGRSKSSCATPSVRSPNAAAPERGALGPLSLSKLLHRRVPVRRPSAPRDAQGGNRRARPRLPLNSLNARNRREALCDRRYPGSYPLQRIASVVEAAPHNPRRARAASDRGPDDRATCDRSSRKHGRHERASLVSDQQRRAAIDSQPLPGSRQSFDSPSDAHGPPVGSAQHRKPVE
jgi:hypothetical protein